MGVEGRRCQCPLDQEANVRADLDTLVIAVYCAACSLFPAPAPKPRRGRSQRITDNELLCLMVAQMLLGQPSDRLPRRCAQATRAPLPGPALAVALQRALRAARPQA